MESNPLTCLVIAEVFGLIRLVFLYGSDEQARQAGHGIQPR